MEADPWTRIQIRVQAGCLGDNSWKPQQGSLDGKPRGRAHRKQIMKRIIPMGREAGGLWKWYRVWTSPSSFPSPRAQAAKGLTYQLLSVGVPELLLGGGVSRTAACVVCEVLALPGASWSHVHWNGRAKGALRQQRVYYKPLWMPSWQGFFYTACAAWENYLCAFPALSLHQWCGHKPEETGPQVVYNHNLDFHCLF